MRTLPKFRCQKGQKWPPRVPPLGNTKKRLLNQNNTIFDNRGPSCTIIIIIIIYNLYRGKAPVTRSDFQGGPLRVKIKYTKAKNIQYN